MSVRFLGFFGLKSKLVAAQNIIWPESLIS